MTEGSDTTTRKLLRQEWKPLAGRRIERYVAMTASHTVPGMEWTDDLAGTSEVVNEVVGYAELRSGRKFPAIEDEAEFREKVEAEAEFVNWLDDDESDDESGSTTDKGEDTGDDDETDSDPDNDGAADADEETVREEDLVYARVDGEPGLHKYDSDDEPYRVPDDAVPGDLRLGVQYEAWVSGVETYGFFVTLQPEKDMDEEDIYGLVHRNHLGLQSASDFTEGEKVVVELEDVPDGDDLGFVLHESASGLDKLFPEADTDA